MMKTDPSTRAVSPLFPISNDDRDVADEAVKGVAPQVAGGDGGDDLVESEEIDVQPKIKSRRALPPRKKDLGDVMFVPGGGVSVSLKQTKTVVSVVAGGFHDLDAGMGATVTKV